MVLADFADQLLAGTWMTVQLAVTSLFFGTILGLLGAGARLSSLLPLRLIGGFYTTVIRGIPELLVVLMIYFGASVVLMGVASQFGYDEYIEINPFTAGVIALSLTFGGYATEVFRGAFQAIPEGQRESAQSLGMTSSRTLHKVILPQVWRYALPGLGNLFLILLKDTALVSVIGLEDLMRKTTAAVGFTREPFTFYLAAAFIYLGLTVISMVAIHSMERKSNRGLEVA